MKSKRLAILQEIDRNLCNCYKFDENCDMCKRLRQLGEELLMLSKENKSSELVTELIGDKIVTKNKVITAAEYSILLNQGRTRKSLAIEYNTSEQKLYRWEKANNIKMPRQLKLTVQQYLDAKAKDLLDKDIAELFNVSPSTVVSIKKQSGYVEQSKLQLTVEQYLSYVRSNMTDIKIAELHNVTSGTITRWKQKYLVR